MADFSGRRISVGLAKETTRGTAVNPTYWAQHLSLDFLQTTSKIFNESVLGVLDKYNAAEIVKDWAEGKIEGKITDKSFGLILASAFGATSVPTLHAGETVVYDHAFTPTLSNTALSLTITRKDPNNDEQFSLAVLKSLEINVVVGDFVKYIATYVSKKGTTSTTTVAYTSENEFKPKYAIAKVATNVAGLAGATAIPMRSMKLVIERQVDPYFQFGSNDPGDIFNGEFNVKGDFVLRYTDNTYKSLVFGNTPQALLLDLKNTDVSLGVGTNPEVSFTLPKVILESWKIDQNKANIVEQTIGFQGLFDQATAKQISAVLTNTVSSY